MRRGTLPAPTQERIALAVAEYRGSEYDVAVHARAGRAVGLDLDEIDSARQFLSRDEQRAGAAALPRDDARRTAATVPVHLHEEAREHGWTDEQILEALAHVALADFSSLVTLAGEIPLEGTSREVKPLKKVA